MIKNKQDYKYYLEADRIALRREHFSSLRQKLITRFIEPDYVWDFQKLLRKVEYLTNKKRTIFDTINRVIQYRKFSKLSLKLGFQIHPNCFGPGLRIVHPGNIIVNGGARIGANCVMFNDVVIGFERNYMDGDPPKIGDNVYFGPGVKIFGPITIADNIAIGANAIVNKSFTEPGITIAGIPAKKVSDNGSGRLVIKATELVDINNYSVKND